jgi:biotin synthase
MPRCHVRLSAGRSEMNDELQALCFLAGANSIFYGEKLLTTGNPDTEHDQSLFRRLNIVAEPGAGQPVAGTPTVPATEAEVLHAPLAQSASGAGFASHAESNAARA